MRYTTIRTLLCSLFLSMLCVGLTLAQEKTVTGTVTDGATGTPLPGVNIAIEGTTTGTTTDAQGKYEITVSGPDAVLVYSFVGYIAQEETVGDRTVIDVALQEEVEKLEEVVVTGYGTQQRQEITGSVSSVDVAEANVGQQASPQELIQGRVSGVNLLENSGEPGSGVSMRIRGTSSITGGTDPLYVVDGVPVSNTNVTPSGAGAGGISSSSSSNPLALLNPQDIESIQVLKDASATAIYGSEGANGVVLIQTKGGQEGRIRIDYSGKVSASTIANPLDLTGGNAFRKGQSCANNLGDFKNFSECFQQRQGDFSGPSTDWQDAAARTGIQHEHNLSLSGGTESTTYRASVSYLRQEGVVDRNALQRVTGRVNVDHQEFDNRLRFGMNLTASYVKRNHLFYAQGGGFQGGVIKGMIGMDPTLRIQNPDTGEYQEFSSSIKNPIALQERVTDITDQNRILGNFSIEADLLQNLTATGRLGIDLSEGIRRTGVPGSGPPLWFGQNSNGLARQAERSLSSIVPQATLEYNDTFFGNHSLQAIAGAEYERETWQAVSVETQNFITDATLFNNLGGGKSIQDPGSTKQLVEQVSFFGKFNYDIGGKYLLTGTVRRDGSSVFGDEQQFASFPSASIGWNLAQESFLQDVGSLTQLKLRVGYGLSGNQAVPPLQSKAVLAPDPGFQGVFGEGENIQTGVAQRRAPNPDLKWEETQEVTVGLDFTAGRFDGTVEFYQKTTDDLLLLVPVPPPAVSTEKLENVGEVQNTGVEASLNALVLDRENLSLRFSGNISSNKNEVRSLGGRDFIDHTGVNGAGQTGVDAQRLEPGHPIGAFYGPVFVRINDQGQEVYKTDDGTTTTLGEAKRTFIGNPVPDFRYGLNVDFRYQNFDVSAFFRGAQGREILNNTALEFTTKSNLGRGINVLQKALEDGTNADHVPVYSSRWVQNASYFRLDNLTIGYNVPNVGAYGLSRARVYGTVQNVFTITPYDGYDPEVNTNVTGRGLGFRSLARPTRGVDYTSYPRPRTFTLGVELSF
jgi:iron complex outermembrane receptor protein